MKKLFKLSLLMFIASIVMIKGVYAFTCDAIIEPETKIEVQKNQEFTLDFVLTDVVTDKVVDSLTATLNYSKDSLTLEKIEGLNGWETPIDGSTFNQENGKIAINKAGLKAQREAVLRLTFKVKENAQSNMNVSIEDIVFADGTGNMKLGNKVKAISLKETSNVNPPVNDGDTDKPNTGVTIPVIDASTGNKPTTPSTSVTPTTPTTSETPTTQTPTKVPTLTDQTTSNGNIPKTGSNIEIITIILGIITIIVAIYSLIRMKLIK